MLLALLALSFVIVLATEASKSRPLTVLSDLAQTLLHSLVFSTPPTHPRLWWRCCIGFLGRGYRCNALSPCCSIDGSWSNCVPVDCGSTTLTSASIATGVFAPLLVLPTGFMLSFWVTWTAPLLHQTNLFYPLSVTVTCNVGHTTVRSVWLGFTRFGQKFVVHFYAEFIRSKQRTLQRRNRLRWL